jgi:hypothetical protein
MSPLDKNLVGWLIFALYIGLGAILMAWNPS